MKILLRVFSAALLVSGCCGYAFAQQERCGTMEHLQQQLQLDPGLAARRQAIEQQTQQYIAHPANLSNRSIITIPTVVHVVYANATENISDAQIQSQIAQLNLDYQKLNPDWTNTPSVWQSLVANYQMEFCLASRDPNGNSTTGIVRKQTTVSSFSTDDAVKYNNQGGDNAWPAGSYLNIWVCDLGSDLLGYAQFPGGAAATDGVVINYTAFGNIGTAQSPYNLGRTATHEIGHWLNLYHIWGDDNGACTGSDQVNDTPNQADEHFGCPTFPTVSCNNGPNGDMFMNYMDYSDDACLYMFTNGQYARSSALFAPGGARYSILSSLGCTPVTNSPIANFSANSTSSCTGQIQFTDQTSGSPTSWAWNFGDGNTSTLQNPSHNYTTNGTFTVSLIATNAYGTDTSTQISYITINKPTAPAVSGGSRCGTGVVTLTAATGDTVKWYSSANASTPIGTGNPFTTPSLTTTTTFYAEAATTGPTYHVGKADNTGSGSYLNSSWYLTFDVLQPCTIQSVYVYAQGSGNRTFEVLDNSDNVVATTTVNVPNGGSRVTLNFSLPAGTGYQLGLPNSSSNIGLYRNNSASTYPYTDAGGYISITGNTVPNNYYYYCYDWIIAGASCVSERVPVVATVYPAVHLNNPSITNVSCFGKNNGLINVTATGGTPAYSYLWSTGATGSSVVNLTAGNYSLTVTDSVGCIDTASAIVTQPTALSTSATSTGVSCNGGSNGSITLNTAGGTPAYSYHWNNGSTNANLNGIAGGIYSATVTDAHSCSVIFSDTISEPAAIVPMVTADNADCGFSNGTASVSVTGGSSPYSYLWSTGSSSDSLNNLGAGAYQITITDAQQCTATSVANVSNTGAITATVSTQGVVCHGGNGGVAVVHVTSGAQPFTFAWSTGVQTDSISNLTAGTYTVTVSDANACSAIFSPVITQPAALQVNVQVTAAGCGTNTGTATVQVSGGAPGYSFAWSNGDSTSTINNLSAGTYSVSISDNNQCSTTATAVVTSGGNLSAQANVIGATCFGYQNGIVSLSVTNGLAPYAFNWSNGDTSAWVNHLAAGPYTVTITDANNCQDIQTITITEPAALNIQVVSDNPTCAGNDGSATATITGGTPNYAYVWSTGTSNDSIFNMQGGNYSVTVDDANHCSASATFSLAASSPINLQMVSTNLSCAGANNGSATVSVSGGAPSYSYLWSNGSSGTQISGLSTGNYVVTVTDANNCTGIAAATITAPALLQFATSTTNDTSGQGIGSVRVTNISGGTPPYSFQWSDGQITNPAINLVAGTYSVTVTDKNGCTQSASVIVGGISGWSALTNQMAFGLYPNPATHSVTLTVSGIDSEINIRITDVLGKSVLQRKTHSQQTDLDVSKFPAGVYLVELKSGNARGLRQLVISR